MAIKRPGGTYPMRFANFMSELAQQRQLTCEKKGGQTHYALSLDGQVLHICYDPLLHDRAAQLRAPISAMPRGQHLCAILFGQVLEFNHKIARLYMSLHHGEDQLILQRLIPPLDEPKRVFIAMLMRFASVARTAQLHLTARLPKAVQL